MACNIPIHASDHGPIVLAIDSADWHRRRRFKRFRFESMWVTEDDCADVVRNGWNEQSGASLPQWLSSVSRALQVWHDEKFGGHLTKIRATEQRFAELLEYEPTHEIGRS